MENTGDIFERLEAEGLARCQMFGLPWQPYTQTLLGRVFSTFEDLPSEGPCDREPTKMIWLRACPCISKIKQRAVEFNNSGTFPQTAAGLYISQVFICAAHVRYFEQRKYPFICAGCGIVYEEFDNLVIREEALQ